MPLADDLDTVVIVLCRLLICKSEERKLAKGKTSIEKASRTLVIGESLIGAFPRTESRFAEICTHLAINKNSNMTIIV